MKARSRKNIQKLSENNRLIQNQKDEIKALKRKVEEMK